MLSPSTGQRLKDPKVTSLECPVFLDPLRASKPRWALKPEDTWGQMTTCVNISGQPERRTWIFVWNPIAPDYCGINATQNPMSILRMPLLDFMVPGSHVRAETGGAVAIRGAVCPDIKILLGHRVWGAQIVRSLDTEHRPGCVMRLLKDHGDQNSGTSRVEELSGHVRSEGQHRDDLQLWRGLKSLGAGEAPESGDMERRPFYGALHQFYILWLSRLLQGF